MVLHNPSCSDRKSKHSQWKTVGNIKDTVKTHKPLRFFSVTKAWTQIDYLPWTYEYTNVHIYLPWKTWAIVQAPSLFLLLGCQWAEEQTWLCLFKMTMTCFLQTSQTKRFLFTVFLRRKNNSRGDKTSSVKWWLILTSHPQWLVLIFVSKYWIGESNISSVGAVLVITVNSLQLFEV